MIRYFESNVNKSYYTVRNLYFGYNIPINDWNEMTRAQSDAIAADLDKHFGHIDQCGNKLTNGPITFSSVIQMVNPTIAHLFESHPQIQEHKV